MAHNNVVWILGAGASADAGAPVMDNFLLHARLYLDDPNSGLDQEEKQRFVKVFKYQAELSRALRQINVDLNNIERLFGLVDMSELVEEESKHRAAFLWWIRTKNWRAITGN